MGVRGVLFSLLVLLLLSLPRPAGAQEATVPDAVTPAVVLPVRPAKEPVPQGVITGHILLADTRAPARGARIMVLLLEAFTGANGDNKTPRRNAEPHTGITNLQGDYSITHVAPGEYVVLAFANGYLSPVDSLTVSRSGPTDKGAEQEFEKKLRESSSLVRVSGSDTARLDLVLERGAALSGRVLYSDGTPAGQLAISLQNVADDAKKPEDAVNMGSMLRLLMLRQSPVTDDNGRFCIAGIVPGTYRLAVMQNFDTPGSLGEEMLDPFLSDKAAQSLIVYSGNTLHRKAAKTFSLHPGDTVTDVELTLPLDGLHTVSGIASATDGTALNGGSLVLEDTADPAIAFHTRLQADGTFHFNSVPEGSYELKASGGRIYGEPPPEGYPAEALQYSDQQFKPQRAFAEVAIAVRVQSADVVDLKLSLADTKLPAPTKLPTAGPAVSDDVD